MIQRIAMIVVSALVLPGSWCGSGEVRGQPEEDLSKRVTLHLRFVDETGSPVRDVAPHEVEVLDSGTELPVVELLPPSQPFDVGLLLDVSPSVHRIVDLIQGETSRLFHSLPEDSAGLLLTFDKELYLDCDWTTDRKQMDEAIYELGLHKPGDYSIIYEALVVALEKKFMERGPRHAMILFSDGVEIGSENVSADESIEVAQEVGTLIFVVQSDSRDHYRLVHGGPTAYDPTRTIDPPGTTGTSVGGIFIGSSRPSERDVAEYKVQRTFERAGKYMTRVALAGRGSQAMLSQSHDLARIYEDILQDISELYTITVVPSRRDKKYHSVTVRSTRTGVTAQPLTKGYWAY